MGVDRDAWVGGEGEIVDRWGLDSTDWPAAERLAQTSLEGVVLHRLKGAAGSGVEIVVREWGEGGGDAREIALLHHANGFCGATLAPIARALSERYRVFSVDARGHGDSTPMRAGGSPDPYHWDALALDVEHATEQVLARTGREAVALAVGHSFGAALLLRAASRAPHRFERLLLCDPVILPPQPPGPPPSEARGAALAAATRRRRDCFPSRAAAYDHFRTRGLFAHFTPEALALYVGEGMAETPEGEVVLKCRPEVEAAIFEGNGAATLFEDLEAVAAKVLFVHAQRGNFEASVFEELAGRMAKARVVSRDLSHLFPLEEPSTVLDLAEVCREV